MTRSGLTLKVLMGTAMAVSMVVAGPASAAAPVTLTGQARIGLTTMPARFAVQCTASGPNATGALGIALSVPVGGDQPGGFDFDAFEGPTGSRRVLTTLTVGGARQRFAASGSYANARVFTLAVSAARTDAAAMAKLAGVLRATKAGTTLMWQQESATAGRVGLSARVELGPLEARRLSTALKGCLG
ncbi:hypothetical protein [Sphingomonas sp. Leaf17]|uniref:hypothetical protein n=1 Tax=Sphingomonas sp. Leaf17 TaxID=1735683 RepID=UPI000AE82916|nr:hypothetical protein [Sphingomonas sp. Leaf17]